MQLAPRYLGDEVLAVVMPRGDLDETTATFERMLWLNPNDNQGAPFCWLDAKAGRSWRQVEDERMQAYH